MKEVIESPKQFHREIQHNKRPPHSPNIKRPNMRFFFLFYTHYYKARFKWRKPVNACQKGQPPSRVNFSEGLYEEKAVPVARANSTRACSDHLTFTEFTRLAEPKVSMEKS